ncbi:hypothetical protein OROHE_021828 [Orobanche hederae]
MTAVAGPIPISEARKNDYQAFRDELDLIDQTNDCSLFPPEYDFTEACSCDECSTKIMELLDFEKEIKSKIKLVRELGFRIQTTEEHCLSLSWAAEWTKKMLDLLHKNLKSVSEKLGVSLTLKRTNSAAKLEDVDLGIVKLISDSRDYGVVDDPKQETEVCDDQEQEMEVSNFADSDKIADEIDTGVFHYRNSKVKDKANGLLQEILEIETEHQKAKKSAELIDPFSSKKQIEKQIKLLKKLPVEELYLEVEELIAKISPIDNNRTMLVKAEDYISSIVCAMIRARMEFWRRYQEFPSLISKGNDKEHSLNGLNHTLDSLLNKLSPSRINVRRSMPLSLLLMTVLTLKGKGLNHSKQFVPERKSSDSLISQGSTCLSASLDEAIELVKSFKNQWEEEYASFVTPYDRSYPKRQRTES